MTNHLGRAAGATIAAVWAGVVVAGPLLGIFRFFHPEHPLSSTWAAANLPDLAVIFLVLGLLLTLPRVELFPGMVR